MHACMQNRDSPRDESVSPEGVAHLSQHRLLPLLHAHAASFPGLASLRFGQQAAALQQEPGAVQVTVDRKAGPLAAPCAAACTRLVACTRRRFCIISCRAGMLPWPVRLALSPPASQLHRCACMKCWLWLQTLRLASPVNQNFESGVWTPHSCRINCIWMLQARRGGQHAPSCAATTL